MDTITLEVHPPYLPREDIRASANAQWALTDLVNMAKYLETHVPGDGNKYKIPVLKSLTEYLNDRVVIGGLKAEGSEAKIIRRALSAPTYSSLIPNRYWSFTGVSTTSNALRQQLG
jgi:hypothetical protein